MYIHEAIYMYKYEGIQTLPKIKKNYKKKTKQNQIKKNQLSEAVDLFFHLRLRWNGLVLNIYPILY